MRKALFPGSFDPVTIGHVEIIERGARMFDEIYVAIGINSNKKYLFPLEERLQMLRDTFVASSNIIVTSYEGLTVDFARDHDIKFLLRGLRTPQDLSYEHTIAFINQHMYPEVETVFLISNPSSSHLSSSIVREVIKYGGKLEGLVPQPVIDMLNRS